LPQINEIEDVNMTLSLTPAYNLKAVLMETGIKPDVLRAWERRYGLPMPQRTAGGHRLYSEHDMAMIKWLISRQNDGLSISRAAEMWKERIAQGQDPLFETQAKAIAVSNLAVLAPPAIYVQPETGIDAIRSRWLTACMKFNEISAEQALNQAFALYPVETVCLDVIQRGMVEIGSLWYENRASIQQEHFTSALAMRRMEALMAASPAPTRSQNVIVGCPADEWHAFTSLLLALFLRRRGFNIIYLGANVPSGHFVETVQAVNASLVVLAAQQLNTAASLQQSAAQLAGQGMPVAFGGRIFAMNPDLQKRIAGHYLGDRVDSAIDRIEILLSTTSSIPHALLPTSGYEATLRAFNARRASIESSMNEEILSQGGSAAYLSTAHKFMGDNIIAALQLGDIGYLNSEIDWLNILLKAQNLNRNVIYDYLENYSAAVSRQLGAEAVLISGWLDQQVIIGKKLK
jgi:methanogenic corrinoid protein MtbC1